MDALAALPWMPQQAPKACRRHPARTAAAAPPAQRRCVRPTAAGCLKPARPSVRNLEMSSSCAAGGVGGMARVNGNLRSKWVVVRARARVRIMPPPTGASRGDEANLRGEEGGARVFE